MKKGARDTINGQTEMNLKSLLIVLLLLCPITANAVDNAGFTIQSASLQRQESDWRLKAKIDYQLSEATIEALNSGVLLTITVELKIEKSRKWLWNKVLIRKTLQFRLRYHGLANIYQITAASSGEQYNFASFEAAMDHLGSLESDLKKLPFSRKPNRHYVGKLRTMLEVEALPLPLRPVAYLSPQWHLTSGWFEWPITD